MGDSMRLWRRFGNRIRKWFDNLRDNIRRNIRERSELDRRRYIDSRLRDIDKDIRRSKIYRDRLSRYIDDKPYLREINTRFRRFVNALGNLIAIDRARRYEGLTLRTVIYSECTVSKKGFIYNYRPVFGSYHITKTENLSTTITKPTMGNIPVWIQMLILSLTKTESYNSSHYAGDNDTTEKTPIKYSNDTGDRGYSRNTLVVNLDNYFSSLHNAWIHGRVEEVEVEYRSCGIATATRVRRK